MLENEIKVGMGLLEYEEYEGSGSEDSFETWKIKKYVDKRIIQAIIGVIAVFVIISMLG